jgi:RNA polymerase sigma-70 factor (ECF subfamily)
MHIGTVDHKDFERLFRENYSRYYYYAFDILGNEEECKDVLSEAFLAVWKNRENVDSDKLKGYLFTSVRNKCLTHINKNKEQRRISDAQIATLAAETEEDWREREERILLIEQEIERLSERTRYVLEQCYYHRHTYREVATELGITIDGVKKHITTAMKHLRQHFNIDKQKK